MVGLDDPKGFCDSVKQTPGLSTVELQFWGVGQLVQANTELALAAALASPGVKQRSKFP